MFGLLLLRLYLRLTYTNEWLIIKSTKNSTFYVRGDIYVISKKYGR